ncbi:MAG TPA: hypothetical protein VIM93_06110 [Kangiella sp.]|uniref:hypothetical protein n=1 Tax=Kangiella sp. TaxID=1920245 RepID=UPI002F9522A6
MKRLLGLIGIVLAIASGSAKSIESSDIHFPDHYKFRLIIAPSFETVTVYRLNDEFHDDYNLLKYQYPNIQELYKEVPKEIYVGKHPVSDMDYKCLLNKVDEILNEIDLSSNDEIRPDGYSWVFESSLKFGVKLSISSPRIKAKDRGLTHLIELKEMMDQTFSTGSLNCSIQPAVEA